MVSINGKKSFDAVEAVRAFRDGHYEWTKDMTQDEKLAFYQREGLWAQAEMERLAKNPSKGG